MQYIPHPLNGVALIILAGITAIALFYLIRYIREDHQDHREMVRQINQKFKNYLDSQDSKKAKQLFIADALLSEIKGKMILDMVDGMPPAGGYTLELTEQEVGMLWSYFDKYHEQPLSGDGLDWTPASIRFRTGIHPID
jgi:hypothetical protein